MASKFGSKQNSSTPASIDLIADFLTPERKAILERIADQNSDAKEEMDLRPAFEEAIAENSEDVALEDLSSTLTILEDWSLIDEAGSWGRSGEPMQETYQLTPRTSQLFGDRGTIETAAIPISERDPGDWARNPVSPNVLIAELVSYVDD